MNVSLPEPMKDWVDSQARTGRYTNASDYVRDLIRRDQERVTELEELQKLITDGIESGISPRSMADILAAAREQASAANGLNSPRLFTSFPISHISSSTLWTTKAS